MVRSATVRDREQAQPGHLQDVFGLELYRRAARRLRPRIHCAELESSALTAALCSSEPGLATTLILPAGRPSGT